MNRVRIEDVDNALGPAAVKRRLTRPLGTTDVALNYYELAPGDSFAFGYHHHADQEEVFFIESGVVTFETADGPIDVAAGEVIHFAPGEFQRGRNTGSERVRALAIGAPRDGRTVEILRTCNGCEKRTPQSIEWGPDRDALVTRCEACGDVTGRFVHGEVDVEAT